MHYSNCDYLQLPYKYDEIYPSHLEYTFNLQICILQNSAAYSQGVLNGPGQPCVVLKQNGDWAAEPCAHGAVGFICKYTPSGKI